MNKASVKIAVSALAICTTQVSCMSAQGANHANAVSGRMPKGEQQASSFFAFAQAAQGKGDVASALRFAELAVEAEPRNASYRLLLGDLYLKNGRFQSAETSFNDVLALDPDNGRAGLSLALVRIALGRAGQAVSGLDALQGRIAPGDIGLAYALAGQPRRAIDLLEPVARGAESTPRIRQNLALAYAIAGDWQKAQAIAAQDVSPADLSRRMEQWASFVQPKGSWDQVASLLGVTPQADSGQPVRLALAGDRHADTALAAAEPVQAPVPEPVAAAEPAPVQVAAVEPPAAPSPSDWGRDPAPQPQAEPAETTRPVYAEAVQSLVAPQPLLRASTDSAQAPVISFPQRETFAAPRQGGRYVVQLGAFASAASVERAWAQAYRRYGFSDHVPLSTTIRVGRGTFHRLSVSGFQTQAQAANACHAVRAKGGACFVRTIAGDTPTRWASRYINRPA
jgi:Flp pilus assembly protein TadD